MVKLDNVYGCEGLEYYSNCVTKCAESHFANYNGKCRYIFEAALGENRTKGAFQIVIGIIQPVRLWFPLSA